MAEYIDLDTPLEVYRYYGSKHEPISTTLRELLDFNKIPYKVADVVPVRTARWDKMPHNLVFNKDGIYNAVFECSECRAVSPFRSNYCLNCGAKMDAKEQKAVYDPDKFFGRK